MMRVIDSFNRLKARKIKKSARFAVRIWSNTISGGGIRLGDDSKLMRTVCDILKKRGYEVTVDLVKNGFVTLYWRKK